MVCNCVRVRMGNINKVRFTMMKVTRCLDLCASVKHVLDEILNIRVLWSVDIYGGRVVQSPS